MAPLLTRMGDEYTASCCSDVLSAEFESRKSHGRSALLRKEGHRAVRGVTKANRGRSGNGYEPRPPGDRKANDHQPRRFRDRVRGLEKRGRRPGSENGRHSNKGFNGGTPKACSYCCPWFVNSFYRRACVRREAREASASVAYGGLLHRDQDGSRWDPALDFPRWSLMDESDWNPYCDYDSADDSEGCPCDRYGLRDCHSWRGESDSNSDCDGTGWATVRAAGSRAWSDDEHDGWSLVAAAPADSEWEFVN